MIPPTPAGSLGRLVGASMGKAVFINKTNHHNLCNIELPIQSKPPHRKPRRGRRNPSYGGRGQVAPINESNGRFQEKKIDTKKIDI